MLQLLAFGTIPLLRVPVPPPAMPLGGAPPLPLALTSAPHGGMLMSAALVNGGTDFRALQLALTSTPALASAGPAIPYYCGLAAVADASLRHACRAVAFARAEWGSAMTSLIKLFQQLEAELPRFEPDKAVHDQLTSAARAFYPSSPVPSAAAELWRALTLGASSGAVQHWAETMVGEPGFAKAAKSVESACASLERLLVAHVARSAELALLCIEELTKCGSPGNAAAGDAHADNCMSDGFSALGLPSSDLASAIRTATQLVALCELARCYVAHARSTYGALFVWLRLLVRQFAASATSSGGVDDPLNTTAASAAGVSAEEIAKRRAQRVPTPQPAEMDLVSAALQPADQPYVAASSSAETSSASVSMRRKTATSSSASAAADPLGLGFSSSFGDDDGDGAEDAGLGDVNMETSFGSANDGKSSSAGGIDPLGLGFSSSLDDSGAAGTASASSGSGKPSVAAAASIRDSTSTAPRPRDPFLPFSLSSLLCGSSDDVITLRHLACEPMASYHSSDSGLASGRYDEEALVSGSSSSAASSCPPVSGTIAINSDLSADIIISSAESGAVSLGGTAIAFACRFRCIVGSVAEALSSGRSSDVGGVEINSSGTTNSILLGMPLSADPDDDGGGGGFNPMAFAMRMQQQSSSGNDEAPSVPLAGSDRLHARILSRATVAWFDDGPGWEWPQIEHNEGKVEAAAGDVPPIGAFGSHVALIPLSPELSPSAASVPTDSDGQSSSAVLVLRTTSSGYPDQPGSVTSAACILALPSASSRVTNGRYYGPAPGAVSAAVAAVEAAGGAFALAPSVASGDSRQVAVAMADFGSSSSSAELSLCLLGYRSLPLVPVPEHVTAAAASDVSFLLDHLTSCGAVAQWAAHVPRSRAIGPIPLAGLSGDGGGVSLRAYAAACDAVSLDVSGPRGSAVVGVGPCTSRRVILLDLAEDDDDNEEGEEEVAEKEVE